MDAAQAQAQVRARVNPGQPGPAQAQPNAHCRSLPRFRLTGQVVYSRSFYTSTVWSRLFLCAGFVATVLLAQAPLNLLWLVLLNLLGALTMHRAVQRTDAALGITAPGDPRGGADEAEGLDGINDCNPLGAQ